MSFLAVDCRVNVFSRVFHFQIWRDYDQWENAIDKTPDKRLAKELLGRLQPKFLQAKMAARLRRSGLLVPCCSLRDPFGHGITSCLYTLSLSPHQQSICAYSGPALCWPCA